MKKNQEKKKILIWSKEKNKKNSIFFKSVLKGKNNHALIRKFNLTSNKKTLSPPRLLKSRVDF